MYSNVLLATDGSDCALKATTHAIDIARTYGARLHALYVVETRTGYDSGIVDPDTVERRLRSEGEAVLADVESKVRDRDGDVVSAVRRGVPATEILEYINEHDVDLVVLGARGRSAFKAILLGSTSEAIVRRALIPVVLLPDSGTGRSD